MKEKLGIFAALTSKTCFRTQMRHIPKDRRGENDDGGCRIDFFLGIRVFVSTPNKNGLEKFRRLDDLLFPYLPVLQRKRSKGLCAFFDNTSQFLGKNKGQSYLYKLQYTSTMQKITGNNSISPN